MINSVGRPQHPPRIHRDKVESVQPAVCPSTWQTQQDCQGKEKAEGHKDRPCQQARDPRHVQEMHRQGDRVCALRKLHPVRLKNEPGHTNDPEKRALRL